MKKSLLLLLVIVLAIDSEAQFDTAAITKNASVKEDTLIALFKRRDWNAYANYMHPTVIEMIGGKEKFVAFLQQAMSALDNASFDTFKNGRVLQIVKSNDQYQCVIESFMQMTFAGVLVSGSSYDLAFSNDGETWSFLRIDQNQTAETIKKLFPELSSDLKLPKSQFQQGKTLEEFMKTYQVQYMN